MSLRFGVFQAPVHPAGENPTQWIQRDLELVEHLDRLGFDEAWIGEHHSGGSAIIASPEIFIAAAAERTKRIKLGTGVTSISYHNPLWVADRMVQLDHQTRGRAILGVGPGSLPTDSSMVGLNPTDARRLFDVDLDIIMRLLAGESVTERTGTHTLVDARLQLLPYSEPCFDIAVAAIASPTGARLAGRHGIGLLSVGATMGAEGFDALAHHWDVVTERAEAYGRPAPDRSGWRLVCPMHVAETREQAYRDVEHGIEEWFRYYQRTAAFPQLAMEGGDVREMIDFLGASGIGVIGTPDDAATQVQRLLDQSGGFGAMLIQAHDWAAPEATRRSWELIAHHVMPRFQGYRTSHAQATLDAKRRAADARDDHVVTHHAAIEQAAKWYAEEKAAREWDA